MLKNHTRWRCREKTNL